MKKSLSLVTIATGFEISCVLWSNGIIFHRAYGPPPIWIESVLVLRNLNLLSIDIATLTTKGVKNLPESSAQLFFSFFWNFDNIHILCMCSQNF